MLAKWSGGVLKSGSIKVAFSTYSLFVKDSALLKGRFSIAYVARQSIASTLSYLSEVSQS